MFQSPVANTANWNFELERIQVPVDFVLRYPGYLLNGIRVSKTGGDPAEDLLLPVTSYIKIKQVGTDSWLELEPLLIRNQALSRRFEIGFPSIYILTTELDPSIIEGVYNAGDWLGSVHDFSFAIQFTDRIERDISHSCSLILAAMQGNVNTDSWTSFCNAIQDKADVSFLCENGSAFTDNIEMIFESGGPDEPFTYIPGTIQLKDIINGRAGSLRLANPGNEANTRYLWVTTDAAHQTRVSYERASVVPETRLILLADLHEWFAPQSRTDISNDPQRFTTGNRLTYFVNGPAFFDDFFKEIREAATDNVGADARLFLAGYAIYDDEKFITTDEDIPVTLSDSAESIVMKGGQCYFLPLQLFEISGGGSGPFEPDEAIGIAGAITLAIAELGIAVTIGGSGVRAGSAVVIMTLPVVAAAVIMAIASDIVQNDFIREKIQSAASSVENLDFSHVSGGRSRKIFALHPAIWNDNPHQQSDSLIMVGLIKSLLRGVTAYHQKVAAVCNTQWVGYCGGIDLNPNRMDDVRHMSAGPYHDVHAKVTGPAAAEIAITFIERWNYEREKIDPPGVVEDRIDINAIDLPVRPSSPITEGDIVQVARTNYQVNPVNSGDRAFPYAPTGDRTILDTILLAIQSAKEYIYIEDQYFTPPKEYRDALMAAIANGLKSLVIILPGAPDQPYGETQRALFINELLATNTDPLNPVVRIGYPRRQYILPSTTTEKLVGRLKIGKDMSEFDTDIMLGPVSRIPTPPFYISVSGEIMLVTAKGPGMTEIDPVVDDVLTPGMDDSYPKYQQYRVERGNATNFYAEDDGCTPRPYKAGTPVTVVVYSGIYVHAKCMMVDDVFLSIGSANMNRRGFYSDAEANVFSIPSQLRFAPDNPVRELRKELWAEHLNLPLSLGKTLLDDPVSSSKLFDRRADSGNRFVPYKSVSTTIKSMLNKVGDISIDANSIVGLDLFKAALSALLVATEFYDFNELFFHASDPSSFSEDPLENIDTDF